MILIGAIFIGFVITQITEIIKKLITNYKSKTFWIPVILGILMSFSGNITLINFVLTKMETGICFNKILDKILTGLILSQGSNAIYELQDFISNLRETKQIKKED